MDNDARKEVYLRDRSEMTPGQARRWRKHDNNKGKGAAVRAAKHKSILDRWAVRVALRKQQKK